MRPNAMFTFDHSARYDYPLWYPSPRSGLSLSLLRGGHDASWIGGAIALFETAEITGEKEIAEKPIHEYDDLT
jgi:hypothetical protein